MRRSILFALSLAAALGTAGTSVARESARSLASERPRVAAATVTLPERSCAGAVAGDREHVVTAAHCVAEDATRVEVRFVQGGVTSSVVEHIDREADLALLRLDRAASAEPLALADDLPRAGERVLFVGRVDRRSRTQVARVERLGRCPSLPGQPRALFTSVQARPGDSGAPLLNKSGEVVAVIHGGAACHIAAPTAPLARRLARPAPDADAEEDGGWFFERTPHGFRFRWKFRWSFGG